MARPKADLPAAADLQALADAEGRLAVRVTPGARSEGIEIADGRVLVKVRTKPEDGKASAAVLELLAQALGVAPSQVEMLRGATSREKLFRIPRA
ncbi:MAG: hypothetical protein B7Y36_06050 [Novosphingobium sp. 28-62-57]|uniref:DUF167 domain-containing protein n=1 Tax=unclassified Novosphingobium TaxID=2644732 RepID=UPI000BCB4A0C|nr:MULTISPECIES: DUF167 domain-containing protein [unclassified Novosphingobium]OYW50199.1 MAG: hypothetical protein B7Z34_04865 [Novosphingobium sp. 12-62-10]OYZ44735.1 MAG: hypothetical protein B7Y31_02375 [Novosphingobium sp. 16-62-11]OZA35771.1 MAG: hypothetical protein B7X92_09100 [Novosphingobium sp. 17-62-9]OYZ11694.1 MAG: hypothetical protein B7Y36_06050 [Novosphingobium sp. 28-62-57]HQS70824.1 DUF167 domain-containing protein [Novosphingobium sp.]